MLAVVTGASGFIGSHLVDGLLAAGYRVRALARHLPGLISSGAQGHPDLTLFKCPCLRATANSPNNGRTDLSQA